MTNGFYKSLKDDYCFLVQQALVSVPAAAFSAEQQAPFFFFFFLSSFLISVDTLRYAAVALLRS